MLWYSKTFFVLKSATPQPFFKTRISNIWYKNRTAVLSMPQPCPQLWKVKPFLGHWKNSDSKKIWVCLCMFTRSLLLSACPTKLMQQIVGCTASNGIQRKQLLLCLKAHKTSAQIDPPFISSSLTCYMHSIHNLPRTPWSGIIEWDKWCFTKTFQWDLHHWGSDW